MNSNSENITKAITVKVFLKVFNVIIKKTENLKKAAY